MGVFSFGDDYMAKEWAKSFYNSLAWKKCREAYIISKYGLCERCKEPGLIVHHKKELNPISINDPNITLSWNNLELLCQDCHNKEHHSNREVIRDSLMFTEDGDIIQTGTPPLKK